MLSTIADILGIISCFISFLLFIMSKTILKNLQTQRKEYEQERFQLQTSLAALRMNIWDDNLLNDEIKSKLRTDLFTYRQKYLEISSISCLFHLFRSLRILNKQHISESSRNKLCISIDFLVARFNKKEDCSNGRNQ